MNTAAPLPPIPAALGGRGVLRAPKSILTGTFSLKVFLHASASLAQGIVGTVTDLPDTGPGDLWQVSYQISGRAFSAGEGFTIYFPNKFFSGYYDLAFQSAPAGWDVLTIQPNPHPIPVELPGFLDALALVNAPPLSDPFVIQFNWMGGGAPGPQAFETYSLNGPFQITGTGNVVVPEATSWKWTPLSLGMLFLAKRFSDKRRSSRITQSSPNHPSRIGN